MLEQQKKNVTTLVYYTNTHTNVLSIPKSLNSHGFCVYILFWVD